MERQFIVPTDQWHSGEVGSDDEIAVKENWAETEVKDVMRLGDKWGLTTTFSYQYYDK